MNNVIKVSEWQACLIDPHYDGANNMFHIYKPPSKFMVYDFSRTRTAN